MFSKSKNEYKDGTLNGRVILCLLALCGLFFFCVGITPLKNDIEVAPLYGNICINERGGAILEEKPRSLIMEYTMQSEKFDISCYNELIADMNSQKVSNIWVSIYASSAIIRWNEKEYFFTRPDKSLVITDSRDDKIKFKEWGLRPLYIRKRIKKHYPTSCRYSL